MKSFRFFWAIKLCLWLFFVGFLFLAAAETWATDPTPPPTDNPAEVTTPDFDAQQDAFVDSARFDKTPKDPRVVVSLVINYAMSLLGVIFLAYLIYGGFMIMTAGGEEERVNTGKSTIKRAIIGLTILLSAYALSRLAFSIATGGNNESGNSDIDPTTEVIPGNVEGEGGGSSSGRCTWIFCD